MGIESASVGPIVTDIHWTPDVVGALFKAADDAYHGRRPTHDDAGAETVYRRWVERTRADRAAAGRSEEK